MFRQTLAFLILLILLVQCQTKTNSPNIILIIADDMNWDDAGTYGHPHVRTPNIDALAKGGMQFNKAYLTASSCSPSRSSIITGKYPHNTGAEQLHWPLPAESKTFVEQLSEAGYYTAAAGKWHLGNVIKDHFDLIREADVSGFQLPTGADQSKGKMVSQQPSGCEDWVNVLQSRPKDKPFFMWFAALDPHREYEDGSLDPPHSLLDVIVPPHLPDVPEVREDLRLYYDEIGRLDKYIGLVMDELEHQGITENTLIVFISDNGRPFPRDKTTLYEGGIKTPFLVKWPAKVNAGSTTNSLVSSVDIAPTLLDVAGLQIPGGFEGVSFLSILENPERKVREHVFAEDHWHDYEDHARSVQSENFKLISNTYNDLPATPSADAGRGLSWQAMLRLYEKDSLNAYQLACFKSPRPRYELYDLESDPDELNNLIDNDDYRQQKDELLSVLQQWQQETNDYVPSLRTPDEFDRVTGEPDHSVRVRPRRSKMEMFGTNGKY